MIKKLDRLQGRDIYENTALAKLNEVIDTINNQQIQLNNHECRLLDLHSRITALDDPTYHEAGAELADPYAEQRRWIGKVCRFWDDDNTNSSCGILTSIDTETFKEPQFVCNDEYDYEHCEPVKPDDDIIYKGGDK